MAKAAPRVTSSSRSNVSSSGRPLGPVSPQRSVSKNRNGSGMNSINALPSDDFPADDGPTRKISRPDPMFTSSFSANGSAQAEGACPRTTSWQTTRRRRGGPNAGDQGDPGGPEALVISGYLGLRTGGANTDHSVGCSTLLASRQERHFSLGVWPGDRALLGSSPSAGSASALARPPGGLDISNGEVDDPACRNPAAQIIAGAPALSNREQRGESTDAVGAGQENESFLVASTI